MSTPDTSQLSMSPSLLKSESKPRPELPPKPSHPSSPPLGERGSATRLSGGKVKSIVSKFSQQKTAPSAVAFKHTNGDAKRVPRRFRRPPTVKPKPGRLSLQLQMRTEQAPPLPLKRSKILQKQKGIGAHEEESVGVKGGRSAPDGKEVEVRLNSRGEAGAQHSPDTPLSPCCDPSCSCACHLQRPGMMLVWVPVNTVEEDKEEDDEQDDRKADAEEDSEEDWEEEEEGESVAGDDMDGASVVEETEIGIQEKAKFPHCLEVLLSEGHRRLSDPGPHSVLSALSAPRSQSPPIPPKRTLSPFPSNHRNDTEEEDENIYEANLPDVDPSYKKCKELDIPLITVRKAHRSKLSSSISDPTSECQTALAPIVPSLEDAPPAIPPRVPIAQDSRSLTPVHRGVVPLPQPTLEEWRSLRNQSPSSSPASGPSPPKSPLLAHRPPPPPPKTDPRRLSCASVQSFTLIKEEENEKHEEENDESGDVPRPVRTHSLRKERSLKREFRLQDEPLYQTYRATVITKEIKRQTVCRNISKTSGDFPMDWAARRSGGTGTGNGTNRGSPLPTPAQSTLWQDLQAVRDSGALEQLSPEQCKYQESMFEVLTSEASYLRSLRVLTEHFLENRDLEETMIIMDRKVLFSNILRIREVSERFLKDLEDRIFEKIVFSDICDIIHYHAQHNFPAYIDYVRNQIYQEKTYTSLIKNNLPFAAVITRLQESPQCQRLPFMSFLLLPFQRITRLKMLIENILKRTKEKTQEEETASKALTSLSKIIDECNTEVGKMKQTEELIHISKTLVFDKLKALPIISPTRRLEKQGELQEMSKGGTLFNMRAKFNPVYLFLFNDLLIITAKKGADRFVVQDYAHRSLVQMQPIDEGNCPYENCFNLILLENHQKRLMERLLKAPKRSDIDRWMAAFPKPATADGDDSEVIYEDWDCPQVQCVEQYIAQQADELSLEPTEIVNVIRKTNEGCYQGIRLSDGQKGWFPADNVIEITNEHVRRRNIRERYRVLQAASTFANSKSRTLS